MANEKVSTIKMKKDGVEKLYDIYDASAIHTNPTGLVKYESSQSLNETEKKTARNNISVCNITSSEPVNNAKGDIWFQI